MIPEFITANLVGALIYLCVAAACTVASRAQRNSPIRRAWLIVAALFCLLAAMRFMGAEDLLRAGLREWLESVSAVEGRRMFQWPLSLVACLGALLAVGLLVRRIVAAGAFSRESMILWAQVSTISMIGLVALRVISLHVIDAVLFSPMIGPIRINWILDIGFSTTVLMAALSASIQRRDPQPR